MQQMGQQGLLTLAKMYRKYFIMSNIKEWLLHVKSLKGRGFFESFHVCKTQTCLNCCSVTVKLVPRNA